MASLVSLAEAMSRLPDLHLHFPRLRLHRMVLIRGHPVVSRRCLGRLLEVFSAVLPALLSCLFLLSCF